MTENQFDELLKAAIQEYGGEYIEIPEEMRKPHHFSRSFERRMQKLIRQAGIQVKHRRLPLRQLIAIIIAAVMVLSAAAMSVSAVRDVIIGFITEVYETFTGVRAEPSEDAPETLEEIYEVTWLPEGYELISEYNNGQYRQLRYEKENARIIFYQTTEDSYTSNYDTEEADIVSVMVGETYGFEIEYNDECVIVWQEDGFVFSVNFIYSQEGKINQNEMKNVANSVKKVEKIKSESN